jgi:hypothetical protein
VSSSLVLIGAPGSQILLTSGQKFPGLSVLAAYWLATSGCNTMNASPDVTLTAPAPADLPAGTPVTFGSQPGTVYVTATDTPATSTAVTLTIPFTGPTTEGDTLQAVVLVPILPDTDATDATKPPTIAVVSTRGERLTFTATPFGTVPPSGPGSGVLIAGTVSFAGHGFSDPVQPTYDAVGADRQPVQLETLASINLQP